MRNPFSTRNRDVRVHLQGGIADGIAQAGVTIEGVLAGENRRHYIIWAPKVLDRTAARGTEPVKVTGHVEVPRERVLFIQVLS